MKRGFTLVEMLVVCAIIGIMVTIVLANTHNLGIDARVKAAQALIIDTAKDTINKSVAVKQFNEAVFPSYGMDIDTASPQQLIIYADCIADDNADGIINNLDTFNYNPSSLGCGVTGTLAERINLDPNTKIKAIRATYPVNGVAQTFTESKVDILFLRPEPTVWITTSSGGLISAGKIEIDVSDQNNTIVRTDIINSSGEFTEK